jgi:hypothetical protein
MPISTGTDLLSDIDNIIYSTLKPEFANMKFAKEENVKPSDSDYSNGFMIRYFVKHVNDEKSPVIEVSKKQYNILKKNPLYKTVDILWKITGDFNYVIKTNKNVVEVSNKEFIGIKRKLVHNLIQFYKIL